MGSIIVLADSHDVLAGRVTAALRHARQPVRVLTPHQLSVGSTWTHRGTGRAIELDIGPHGSHAIGTPRAVLNRLQATSFFPSGAWGTREDATYAEAEFAALVSTWLASLRCLVLGPAPISLLYQHTGIADWLDAARDAWLPTRSVTLATGSGPSGDRGAAMLNSASCGRQVTTAGTCVRDLEPDVVAEPVTAMRSVYVVAGRVLGAPDYSLVPGLLRLAEQAACNLLECQFGWTGDGRWVFCDASTAPADGPDHVVDAILSVLTHSAAVRG